MMYKTENSKFDGQLKLGIFKVCMGLHGSIIEASIGVICRKDSVLEEAMHSISMVSV
jgi:hypothetical protein